MGWRAGRAGVGVAFLWKGERRYCYKLKGLNMLFSDRYIRWLRSRSAPTLVLRGFQCSVWSKMIKAPFLGLRHRAAVQFTPSHLETPSKSEHRPTRPKTTNFSSQGGIGSRQTRKYTESHTLGYSTLLVYLKSLLLQRNTTLSLSETSLTEETSTTPSPRTRTPS